MTDDTSTKPFILPFYALVDVSWSMMTPEKDGLTGIDAVNRIAPEVFNAIMKQEIAADLVRFGMLDFSGEVQVVLPLMDPRDIRKGSLPTIEARTTGTSYMSAFLTMRAQIEADVQQLRASGFRIQRPAVFFLTDGEPTDTESDWMEAFDQLRAPDFDARPNVVPFGIRDAKKEILDRIAAHKGPQKSFVARELSATEAIQRMIELLIGSIIATANTVGAVGTAGGFQPPIQEEDDDDWLMDDDD